MAAKETTDRFDVSYYDVYYYLQIASLIIYKQCFIVINIHKIVSLALLLA